MRYPVLGLCVLCLGCGTFTLDMGGYAVPPGKTAQQAQLDQLTCKDMATTYSMSAGSQARDFLLGLTIVGTPLAYSQDKEDQRRIYAECMMARGYTVRPGTD